MTRVHAAICAAGLLALAVVAPAAPASAQTLDPAAAFAKGTQALGRTIGNYTLVDMNGSSLALRDYRGKPLVVSLVFTACSSVCPPTTQHVIDAVNEAGRMIGLDRFNVLTVGFDAREWVRIAQDAGMRYMVITSKHHDGFCIWDSALTDYDIMATPFKRDILRELSDQHLPAIIREEVAREMARAVGK